MGKLKEALQKELEDNRAKDLKELDLLRSLGEKEQEIDRLRDANQAAVREGE
jgi:hypothetical protein